MPAATFAAPTAKPRRASSVADAVLASAVDVARAAAIEVAGPGEVGEPAGVKAEGHRLATHYFTSTAPGYRGWHWAVTLARAPRARVATVCEVALLPGDGAIVAPPWVPWSDRLQPGDVGLHDVLPFVSDDPRLEPGYEATGDDDADHLALYELGLGRARVLSPEGRDDAAIRWYEGDRGPVRLPTRPAGRDAQRRPSPVVPMGQCSTCGFLLFIAGSLRPLFGVCANEWSPDDGRVVSMDHGCGAHSETDIDRSGSDWPENAPVVDDHGIEFVDRRIAAFEVGEEPEAELERAPEPEATELEATEPVPPAPEPEATPEPELALEATEPVPPATEPEPEPEATPEPELAPEAPEPEAAAPEPEAELELAPEPDAEAEATEPVPPATEPEATEPEPEPEATPEPVPPLGDPEPESGPDPADA